MTIALFSSGDDQAAVVERGIQIARQAPAYDDEGEYRADTVRSRVIRDEAPLFRCAHRNGLRDRHRKITTAIGLGPANTRVRLCALPA
jgi:hypothetical protein